MSEFGEKEPSWQREGTLCLLVYPEVTATPLGGSISSIYPQQGGLALQEFFLCITKVF